MGVVGMVLQWLGNVITLLGLGHALYRERDAAERLLGGAQGDHVGVVVRRWG